MMRSYRKVTLVVILCQYCVLICAQVSEKFFRNDYTYFENTKTFYKIHTLHKTWLDAKRMCTMEGASLFYPIDKNEADLMVWFLNSTQPFHWLSVGASDLLSKGVYQTFQGVPVSNTYHNWAPGEPNGGNAQNCVVIRRDGFLQDENCMNEYPFVCQKTLSSLEWNQPCNMPFMDYEYNEDTRQCYKIHLKRLGWSNAFATCSAELSYLAVINSPLEAEILANMTAEAPKDSFNTNFVHLGFQNIIPDEGWLTVKGIPLEESGYACWHQGEPNNEISEKCGSMYYNGQLNDIGCQDLAYFICVHDIYRSA